MLSKFRRYVWTPSKWLFTPLALCFIAYVVWQSRFDIVSLWTSSSGLLLLLACVSLGVAHGLLPLASRSILRLLGVRVDYLLLLRTHVCRLPARYLPGGIWHTVGRAVDLHEYGVPKVAIGWTVALENGLAVGTAFFLGSAFLLVSSAGAISYSWLVGLIGVTSLVVLLALPFLVSKFARAAAFEMHFFDWVICSAWFLLVWTFQALAFVAYSVALLGESDPLHMLYVAGVYLFSWAVGFTAFFAPQGIGVFEATATMLSGESSAPASLAVVAGFRLCMLVVDLTLGLAGRILKKPAQ